MSKQLCSQRYIFKIPSKRLADNDWQLELTINEARNNEELIALGDSQILRFIREITNTNYSEYEIRQVKQQIKALKKEDNSKRLKMEISELYTKLDNMLFVRDYVAIEFNNKKDFGRATSKKGFYINGVKFKRLVGTTGGVKANTVMFCSETIYDELAERLDCGRNPKTKLVPAKLEAYKALACSVSNIVTNNKRLLIIQDGSIEVTDKAIKVSDNGDDYNVEHNVDYTQEKEFCDGCGLISPQLAEQWCIDLGMYHYNEDGVKVADYIPSGFNTRYAFEKGMVVTFDFQMFAKDIAKTYLVKDAWGHERDIRDVDLILTTNQVKLWSAYDSMEDYLANCDKYNYKLSVTKVCPKELEKKRNMNYQYLQSYDFSEEDIEELCEETISNINGVVGEDLIKSILFTHGTKYTIDSIINSENDVTKALIIDQRAYGDCYIRTKLNNLIKKKIKEAKKGVIQVTGSYVIICGDVYALCQSMFGMEVTGLLKHGEFYSRTWSDRGEDKIVSFRSPMTCHNNISIKNLVDNEEVRKWYKYIKTMTVFNCHDFTTDTMNGAD